MAKWCPGPNRAQEMTHANRQNGVFVGTVPQGGIRGLDAAVKAARAA